MTKAAVRICGPVLFIEGRCGGRHKKLINQAADFYLSHLLPRHVYDRIIINVKMIGQRRMKGNEGTCLVVETDKQNRPIEFELELNRDTNTKTMLHNLAHEIVHVKQFALGELDEQQTRWNGKRVDDEKVAYWDLPWEIDAYGRERGLYARFIAKYDLHKIDDEPLL
jgi:hypothetical protein